MGEAKTALVLGKFGGWTVGKAQQLLPVWEQGETRTQKQASVPYALLRT